MDYIFLAKLKLKELNAHKKYTLIFIISLSLSMFFILIFSNKLLSIQDSLSKVNMNTNGTNLRMSQSPIKEDVWHMSENAYDIGQIQSAKLITTIHSDVQSYKVKAINHKSATFYHDLMLPQSFQEGKNVVICPTVVAEKYGLKFGDWIQIMGKNFKYIGSHDAYYFKESLIIPIQSLLNKNLCIAEELLLDDALSKDKKLLNLLSAKGYQSESFVDYQNAEKQSLFNFLMFVFLTSLIFFLISFINCLLTFEGRRKKLQKISAIHHLCGSSTKQQRRILFIENIVLGELSLLLAVGGIIIGQDFLPNYFKVKITFSLFFITNTIMILILYLFSRHGYKQMIHEQLIYSLKEVGE